MWHIAVKIYVYWRVRWNENEWPRAAIHIETYVCRFPHLCGFEWNYIGWFISASRWRREWGVAGGGAEAWRGVVVCISNRIEWTRWIGAHGATFCICNKSINLQPCVYLSICEFSWHYKIDALHTYCVRNLSRWHDWIENVRNSRLDTIFRVLATPLNGSHSTRKRFSSIFSTNYSVSFPYIFRYWPNKWMGCQLAALKRQSFSRRGPLIVCLCTWMVFKWTKM